MSEFTTKSGAKVTIGIAPWVDAKRLKQVIQLEAAAAGLSFNLQSDISTLIGALLKVDGSPAVDAALWPCLARCTYDDGTGITKITESLLDNAKPRGDYYEIVIGCVTENLGPLTESLYFVLPDELKAILPFQKRSSRESQ